MPKIILLLLFSLCSAVNSKNYHVQTRGNDANDGLSFATGFLTIQKATNLAQAGDSILVYDGSYKGFDHFYKKSGTATLPIVYFAKGKSVIINQSCGRGGDGINIEGNDYIELIGFKVQFIPDITGGGEDGIRVVLANHVSVRNCEVDSCYRGIFTGYTDDFLAENNICKRSFGEHGIYVSNNSDRVVIRNNICFNNRRAAGIQLNPDLSSGGPGISGDVKIYNNICYGNRIGLNLQGIYYSVIYNNLIYNNGSGGGGNGVTFFLGDAATGCNDVKFYNNTIVVPSTSQWGILAIDSDSLQIYNNIIVSFSVKGSLYIDKSCTNYLSDYNVLNDKMTQDDGATYINFQQWQKLGFDIHSILVKDNNILFRDYSTLDFQLYDKSPARNSGSNQVSAVVKDDLLSILRPQGIAYDIGCYEFQEITGVHKVKNKEKINYILKLNSLEILSYKNNEIYSLYNLQGIKVREGFHMDVDVLSPGIYILSNGKNVDKIFIH
ncbi:MAG: DUF1565 domain-containing protein [Saprospiraceae bacterium]|nr:DUF1565 domain-containing protein [Saprospiraceae bacterium]